MTSVTKDHEVLVRMFLRNGVFRRPNKKRMKEGSKHYKKGYEIRWTAFNKGEEILILQKLNKLGFKHGKSFKKVNRIIIPVYGYDSTMEFQKIISMVRSKKVRK